MVSEFGPDYFKLPWRVGRTLGRTVYAAVGDEASKNDIFLGLMDSRELAAHVVEVHNRAITRELEKP